MKAATPMITVTLRKVSSGAKVFAFTGEDVNHLYSMAKVLVKSTEYSRCYAVALDWQGDTLWQVYPPNASAPAPYQAPQALPQQSYYQQPAYPPHMSERFLPQSGYAPPPAAQPRVIEADFEPVRHRLPQGNR